MMGVGVCERSVKAKFLARLSHVVRERDSVFLLLIFHMLERLFYFKKNSGRDAAM